MLGPKTIIFITEAKQKVQEIKYHLDKYGINIYHYENFRKDNLLIYSEVLVLNPNLNIYALMREKTDLFKANTTKLAKKRHLEAVDHHSLLTIYFIQDQKIVEEIRYHHTTSGYINLFGKQDQEAQLGSEDLCLSKSAAQLGSEDLCLSKSVAQLGSEDLCLSKSVAQPFIQDIFGWDDIFYLNSHHENYHTLRQKNLKISSRDMNISKFIKDTLHYKKMIDLCHHPQNFTQSIAFDTNGIILIWKKMIHDYPKFKSYGILHIINFVFSSGVYFSSPLNRRIKLNWNPGIGPIPLTRKETDFMHEMTYAVHDYGHLAIRPDLTYVGTYGGLDASSNSNPIISALNRKLCLINRMGSEAITLCIADMLFVKSIEDSGGSYKTKSDRKIYPLFEKIMPDFDLCLIPLDYIRKMKPIIKANFFYCILGDKSLYEKLLPNPNNQTEFVDFDKKYSQFFIQDYIWTDHNYKQMVVDHMFHTKWWEIVSTINDKFSLGLISIDTFRNILYEKYGENLYTLSNDILVSIVFDYIFEHNVEPIFKRKISNNLSNHLPSAFIRYLCNQIFIFVRYEHEPYAKQYLETILNTIDMIHQKKLHVNEELIRSIRIHIKKFIDDCVRRNTMTFDDGITYEQLYSIVDPFVVNYDIEHESNLSEVAKKILD